MSCFCAKTTLTIYNLEKTNWNILLNSLSNLKIQINLWNSRLVYNDKVVLFCQFEIIEFNIFLYSFYKFLKKTVKREEALTYLSCSYQSCNWLPSYCSLWICQKYNSVLKSHQKSRKIVEKHKNKK